MRRREFIMLLGSAAAALPVAAHAEQADRVRRIGVLMAHPESDPEYQSYFNAFRQERAERGWREDRNIKIEFRWGALDDPETRERSARELLALKPDLLLTQNTPPTASMLHLTRTVPVVFVVVTDPLGSGFVKSLPLPGGNATGFTIMEPSISGKWLELLKEIVPQVRRVAFLFNPATAPYVDVYLNPFKAAAKSLALEGFPTPVDEESELKTYSRHRLIPRTAAWF
jgi:putative ABC transport system substrate-binding protein